MWHIWITENSLTCNAFHAETTRQEQRRPALTDDHRARPEQADREQSTSHEHDPRQTRPHRTAADVTGDTTPHSEEKVEARVAVSRSYAQTDDVARTRG